LDSIKDEIWPDVSTDGTAAVAYHPDARKEGDEEGKKGDRTLSSVDLALCIIRSCLLYTRFIPLTLF